MAQLPNKAERLLSDFGLSKQFCDSPVYRKTHPSSYHFVTYPFVSFLQRQVLGFLDFFSCLALHCELFMNFK